MTTPPDWVSVKHVDGTFIKVSPEVHRLINHLIDERQRAQWALSSARTAMLYLADRTWFLGKERRAEVDDIARRCAIALGEREGTGSATVPLCDSTMICIDSLSGPAGLPADVTLPRKGVKWGIPKD